VFKKLKELLKMTLSAFNEKFLIKLDLKKIGLKKK
jgi:hypothetical protein